MVGGGVVLLPLRLVRRPAPSLRASGRGLGRARLLVVDPGRHRQRRRLPRHSAPRADPDHGPPVPRPVRRRPPRGHLPVRGHPARPSSPAHRDRRRRRDNQAFGIGRLAGRLRPGGFRDGPRQLRAHPAGTTRWSPAVLPLTILVDYDGTIAQPTSRHAHGRVSCRDGGEGRRRYDAGEIGSRELMEWEVGLSAAAGGTRCGAAAASPTIPVSRPSSDAPGGRRAGRGRERRARLLHRRRRSRRLGVGGTCRSCRATTSPERAADRFPTAIPHASCAARASGAGAAHQARRRPSSSSATVTRDRYAAGYADIVFAKRALSRLRRGRLAVPALDGVSSRSTSRSPAVIESGGPTGPAPARPAAQPFYCGPEVWGEGRWDPPPAGRLDGR